MTRSLWKVTSDELVPFSGLYPGRISERKTVTSSRERKSVLIVVHSC